MMREDVDEEFSARAEGTGYFCQEERVVLHVLKEFNRDYAVKGIGFELIVYDVASDDCEVGE